MKKHSSNRFCLNLLGLKIRKAKAITNLVMALSSHVASRSVVELSLSGLYHYQYSSLSDSLSNLARNRAERALVQTEVQGLIGSFCDEAIGSNDVLHSDVTTVLKRYSPSLEDRTHVSIPNTVISGNKPLDVGYELSYVNLGIGGTNWSLPLHVDRVNPDQTPADCLLSQLHGLMAHPELKIGNRTIINTLDSAYGSPAYLSRSYEIENLVNVVRLRHGRNVWTKFEPDENSTVLKKQSRPRIFGDQYCLISESCSKTYKKHPKTGLSYQKYHRSIFEWKADEMITLESKTAKGRLLKIEIWRWNNMLMATKRGYKMSDKPIDILACRTTDLQTGKRVFDLDMFLAISGQRKNQITTQRAYQAYRSRYNIEGYFRFAKQQLLLEKYQTPDVEHFENWIICQILASWLLYLARNEVQFIPHKWEKYLPHYNSSKKDDLTKDLSITQVRRAAQNLFLTFDQKPFLPQKSNKGRPRAKGEKQPKRTSYPVVKKKAKWVNKKAKIPD